MVCADGWWCNGVILWWRAGDPYGHDVAPEAENGDDGTMPADDDGVPPPAVVPQDGAAGMGFDRDCIMSIS